MRYWILSALACVMLAQDKPQRTAGPESALHSTPVVKPEDRLRVKDAQLRRERALTALLQSPQYAALQSSDVDLAAMVADVEKRSGCKLDPATVECVPPVKPEPAVKPEAKK